MLVTTWSDKGGPGKTTIAVQLAKGLKATLMDLDRQRDALEWAKKTGYPSEDLAPLDQKTPSVEFLKRRGARLLAAAEDDAIWVADSRPGTELENLQGMAYSQLVVIPTRTDERDLRGLGRALDRVKQFRAESNPRLRVGVVVNALRDTTWDKNTTEQVRQNCALLNLDFLGELKDRRAYKDTYTDGEAVVGQKGPGGDEVGRLISRVRAILKEIAAGDEKREASRSGAEVRRSGSTVNSART